MAKDVLYPLRRLHGKMYEWEQRQKRRRQDFATVVLPLKKAIKRNPKAVLLVMTPEHSNLGDHAITVATHELLRNAGILSIEVTDQQLMALKRIKMLRIMDGHPILICGGGNMGTLWMNLENLMREITQSNPKSKIIILPNTVFYEKNEWGRKELQKSIQIYNQHQYLMICAREQTSYDFMKPIYRDVRLVPDMVFSLKKDDLEYPRSGCLLCLRSDCEKTRTEDQEHLIREQAEALFREDVRDSDMVIGDCVPVAQREIALERKFAEFSSAKLVITDRLHGMIFCAITATPCIVIDSKSPKVRGCYEWIRNLEYIRFADDVSRIADIYSQIPEKEFYYDNSHLQKYYDELAEVVKEYAHN